MNNKNDDIYFRSLNNAKWALHDGLKNTYDNIGKTYNNIGNSYDNTLDNIRRGYNGMSEKFSRTHHNNFWSYFVYGMIFLTLGTCIINIVNVSIKADETTYIAEIIPSAVCFLFFLCLFFMYFSGTADDGRVE
jgi:hypothetical protein